MDSLITVTDHHNTLGLIYILNTVFYPVSIEQANTYACKDLCLKY